jgi:hypothetical protein
MMIKNIEKYKIPKHDHVQKSDLENNIEGYTDVDLFLEGKFLYTAFIKSEDIEE